MKRSDSHHIDLGLVEVEFDGASKSYIRSFIEHARTLVPEGDPTGLGRLRLSVDVKGAHIDVNGQRLRLPSSPNPLVVAWLCARALAIHQERLGRLTLHAAAVELQDGRAVVMAGPSLSGKTSTSLVLEESYGATIMASNYVTIDASSCEITAGTRAVTARSFNSIEPLSPRLQRVLPALGTPRSVAMLYMIVAGDERLVKGEATRPALSVFLAASEVPRMPVALSDVELAPQAVEDSPQRLLLCNFLVGQLGVIQIIGSACALARAIANTP